jgi:type VI secretion system protein ImpF
MAELTPQERLQPALLDRLTDEDPSKRQEPREARVMSRQKLRQAVLRDLAWLFNATHMTGVDWTAYPDAEHSVINYGLPALSGETASSLDAMSLERTLRQVILDFEPRISPASLQVEALISEIQLEHHNVISVQIRGQLWSHPVPIELLLRTELDLETGQVEIREVN